MYVPYLQLCAASLLPVILSVVFFKCEQNKRFATLPNKTKQLIFGVSFGLLAMIGTEFGIPLNGAIINCRDASVMCAGLLFGGPAGVIAGLIGGMERWLCVYWGGGTFTRVACSVSTMLAGVYAASLRKYLFDYKKPSWALAGLVGLVMEVFHLTMVFITNLNDTERATEVVRVCSLPLILSNALSLLMATLVLSLLSGDFSAEKVAHPRISQTIQRWLMICVVVTFLTTSAMVNVQQNKMASRQTESQLRLSLEDVEAAIHDASDKNILDLTKKALLKIYYGDLQFVAKSADVAEINVIDSNGIIVKSTYPDFLGYNMADGEQSAEFLPLLDGTVTEMVQAYGPISYDSSISRKYAAIVSRYGGFVQVGFDSSQFQKYLSTTIPECIRYRHVGTDGFLFVSNEAGEFVAGAEQFGVESVSELPELQALLSSSAAPETVHRLNLGSDEYFLMFTDTEGYRIFSVIPVDAAMENRNVVVFANSYLQILTFAVQFLLIYILIKKVVVNNILTVNESLSKITDGDLDVTVDVRDNLEFSSLSDDINSTVATMKRYIAEAAARIDAELEFARSIQTSSLPNTFPPFPNHTEFDIFALMDTAKEVGGDFYDFYLLGEDKLCFVVADVSGKGIPASLFMMRAKTELKRLAETGADLDAVFSKANRDLCSGNEAGMFVTAWMGIMDLRTGMVEFVNAGHNPPLINYENSGFEYLRSRAGLVLGGMPDMKYRRMSIQLNKGDILFLYTDGVTEATNAENQLFGEDRLISALDDAEYSDMQSLCACAKTSVEAFVASAPQFDDITMFAIRFFGRSYPTMHFDKASIADISTVTEFVESELEKLDCPMNISMKLSVAIDEIFSNIVYYAYEGGSGPVTVEVRPQAEPLGVTLVFEDEGVPYNPLAKQDPDVSLSADDRAIGGLGILIVKKFMDDVSYEYKKGKNVLSLYKQF